MDRPDGHDPAKNRFLIITLMRFGGVAMILMGLAVANGAISLPAWTAWLLIGLGFIELLVVPQMLARLWRSDDRRPPRQ